MIKPFLNLLESDCPGDKAKELQSMGYGTRYNNSFLPRIDLDSDFCGQKHDQEKWSELKTMLPMFLMPLLMAQTAMLCRSEGNWGEYGLSKAAVNC